MNISRRRDSIVQKGSFPLRKRNIQTQHFITTFCYLTFGLVFRIAIFMCWAYCRNSYKNPRHTVELCPFLVCFVGIAFENIPSSLLNLVLISNRLYDISESGVGANSCQQICSCQQFVFRHRQILESISRHWFTLAHN